MRRWVQVLVVFGAFAALIACAGGGAGASRAETGIAVPPDLGPACAELFLDWGRGEVSGSEFAQSCLEASAVPVEFKFSDQAFNESALGPATRCWGYAERPWRSTILVRSIGYGAWLSCDGEMSTIYLRAELQRKRVIENYGTISEQSAAEAFSSFTTTTGQHPCVDEFVFSGDSFRTYAFATGINSAGLVPNPPYDEGLSGQIGGTTLCLM